VTTGALVFDRRSKNFLTFYNTCCGITPGSVGFSLSSFTGSLGSLGTAEAQGEDYCGGGPVGLPATFSSSNPAISTVSSAGDVTGVSPGSTSTNTFVAYSKQKTIDGCTNASQSNSAPTNVINATITVHFAGSKAPGDNLSFPTNQTCSQSLGLLNCPSTSSWRWNVEIQANVSDDSSGVLHSFDQTHLRHRRMPPQRREHRSQLRIAA
jgi:hypothetical protein